MLAASTWAAIGSTGFLVGCATPPERSSRRLTMLTAGTIEIRVERSAAHEWLVAHVEASLPFVAHRLATFALAPTLPTLLRVHDDVASFVRATGVTAPHLRAWAGYATVDLAPPSTWREKTADVLAERLTHELCHCGLAQATGDERAARARPPPFFVDEGVSSVVADQGARRMPRADLVAAAGDENPLEGARAWPPAVAYAAAHHAMAVVRAGADPLVFRRVIDRARAGSPGRRAFLDALERETGHTPGSLWRALRGHAV